MRTTSEATTIEPHYYHWRTMVERRHPNRAAFEKWLFLHTANVLFGQKAGELLTLTAGQFDLDDAAQRTLLEETAALWKIGCCVLHRNAGSSKFIIFEPRMVQQQLDAVPPCILQEVLEYPIRATATDFLAEVQRRWARTGKIPHEIGFALGYPVKDVLGYMGLQALPCSGCCGWQVYGEFAPSHRLCLAFMKARQEAIRFLHLPDTPTEVGGGQIVDYRP